MRDPWSQKCIFAPSLITLDMCNLESQVKTLQESGIEILHVDILDGYFSPCMPLGLDTVRQLRAKTDLEFDCHLMVEKPEFFIDQLLDIGVQQITFHSETASHIDGLLNRIHAQGVKCGIALRPATPLSVLDYVLEKCDTVTLMLINPGYAYSKNEKQISYAERKIRELRKMIDQRGLKTKIEIDGRISMENIEQYGAEDVQLFVCGSTCINREDIGGSIKNLDTLRKKILGETI